MENNLHPTREEMEQMIEKAKRDWQETLAKMTPEEREEAIQRAQQAVEKDEAERQQLLEDCAKILEQSEQRKKAKFCQNCGAPVSGGNFCTYCGKAI